MKVLIGLPAYNEETGISHLLRRIAHFRNISRYPVEVWLLTMGAAIRHPNA
jgi:hypothetical protein